jgi:hypothetical protein
MMSSNELPIMLTITITLMIQNIFSLLPLRFTQHLRLLPRLRWRGALSHCCAQKSSP